MTHPNILEKDEHSAISKNLDLLLKDYINSDQIGGKQKTIKYISTKKFDVFKLSEKDANGKRQVITDYKKIADIKQKHAGQILEETSELNSDNQTMTLKLSQEAKIIGYNVEAGGKIHLQISTKKKKDGSFSNSGFAIDFDSVEELRSSLIEQKTSPKKINTKNYFDENSEALSDKVLTGLKSYLTRFPGHQHPNFIAFNDSLIKGENIKDIEQGKRNVENNPMNLIRPKYLQSFDEFFKSDFIITPNSGVKYDNTNKIYYRLGIEVFERMYIGFLELLNVKDKKERQQKFESFLTKSWKNEQLSNFCKDSSSVWGLYFILTALNNRGIPAIGRKRALELFENIKGFISKSGESNGFDNGAITRIPKIFLNQENLDLAQSPNHLQKLKYGKNLFIKGLIVLDNSQKIDVQKTAENIINNHPWYMFDLSMLFLHDEKYCGIAQYILKKAESFDDQKLLNFFKIYEKSKKEDNSVEHILDYFIIKQNRRKKSKTADELKDVLSAQNIDSKDQRIAELEAELKELKAQKALDNEDKKEKSRLLVNAKKAYDDLNSLAQQAFAKIEIYQSLDGEGTYDKLIKLQIAFKALEGDIKRLKSERKSPEDYKKLVAEKESLSRKLEDSKGEYDALKTSYNNIVAFLEKDSMSQTQNNLNDRAILNVNIAKMDLDTALHLFGFARKNFAGLSFKEAKEKIKIAYRKISLKLHPDGNQDGLTDSFQKYSNIAYDLLRKEFLKDEATYKVQVLQ